MNDNPTNRVVDARRYVHHDDAGHVWKADVNSGWIVAAWQTNRVADLCRYVRDTQWHETSVYSGCQLRLSLWLLMNDNPTNRVVDTRRYVHHDDAGHVWRADVNSGWIVAAWQTNRVADICRYVGTHNGMRRVCIADVNSGWACDY